MKRILIICFFLITKHSYSQLALPFPDSTANWVITECFSGGGAPGAFYCFNYRYFSLGDTSMNGFTYKILNESYNLDPSDTISSSVVGYYRIDGQKVFYLQDSSYNNSIVGLYNSFYFNTGQEILLYDFGMQIGDTFSLSDSVYFAFQGRATIVLTQIDTIQLSGQPVRRFNFTTSNLGCDAIPYYYWYEGIGSSFGFFPNFYCFENGVTFDCFHENNVDYVFYLQPGDDCMNITLGANNPDKVKKLTVFPNPSDGLINIQSDFNDDKVVITDMTGKCISSLKITVGNNLLNIQNLLPGLYFLRTKIGVEKVLIF